MNNNIILLAIKTISNIFSLFGINRVIKNICIAKRDIKIIMFDAIAHYDIEANIKQVSFDIIYEKPCILIKFNTHICFYMTNKMDIEVPGNSKEDYSYYINIMSKIYKDCKKDFRYIYNNIQKIDKDLILDILEEY